ncbi:hypothetical protein [Arthrobacter sp. UYCo732]|uniref:hypothetical protein n=1 Tax=Arthrobacter sp. UYCo732 TaxID=3156336 RepID=UPI003396E963
MKKLIAPFLLIAALSGCAGAPAAPAATMPSVEKRESLMKELAVVSPELAHPGVVARARSLCPGIANGAPEAEQLQVVRNMVSKGGAPITEEQAGKVVSIIKSSGFCTPA